MVFTVIARGVSPDKATGTQITMDVMSSADSVTSSSSTASTTLSRSQASSASRDTADPSLAPATSNSDSTSTAPKTTLTSTPDKTTPTVQKTSTSSTVAYTTSTSSASASSSVAVSSTIATALVISSSTSLPLPTTVTSVTTSSSLVSSRNTRAHPQVSATACTDALCTLPPDQAALNNVNGDGSPGNSSGSTVLSTAAISAIVFVILFLTLGALLILPRIHRRITNAFGERDRDGQQRIEDDNISESPDFGNTNVSAFESNVAHQTKDTAAAGAEKGRCLPARHPQHDKDIDELEKSLGYDYLQPQSGYGYITPTKPRAVNLGRCNDTMHDQSTTPVTRSITTQDPFKSPPMGNEARATVLPYTIGWTTDSLDELKALGSPGREEHKVVGNTTPAMQTGAFTDAATPGSAYSPLSIVNTSGLPLPRPAYHREKNAYQDANMSRPTMPPRLPSFKVSPPRMHHLVDNHEDWMTGSNGSHRI